MVQQRRPTFLSRLDHGGGRHLREQALQSSQLLLGEQGCGGLERGPHRLRGRARDLAPEEAFQLDCGGCGLQHAQGHVKQAVLVEKWRLACQLAHQVVRQHHQF